MMEESWDRRKSIAINYKEYRSNEGSRRAVVFVEGGKWKWGDYGVEFVTRGKLHVIPWENILSVEQALDGEFRR